MERYKIVASFDKDTCSLCADMDGKVFKMSDYQVGLTAPPFHPWCRCCTCPYFEDMDGMGERYARDAVTGERFKVPGNMTYDQWKAQQDALHGQELLIRCGKSVIMKLLTEPSLKSTGSAWVRMHRAISRTSKP